MGTAHFRIVLWQAKNPHQSLARLVTEDNLECAVFCALQWVSWSNDGRPRSRTRFNAWKVQERDTENCWHTTKEGTLDNAKMEQSSQNPSTSKVGTVLGGKTSTQRRIRAVTGVRDHKIPRAETRLATAIAQLKNRR